MIASDAIYFVSRVAGSHSEVNGESTGRKKISAEFVSWNRTPGLKSKSKRISCLSANADGRIPPSLYDV